MRSILTIALALVAAVPLAAQTEQALLVGARVRITTPDTMPTAGAAKNPRPLIVVGKLVAVDDSTLLIRNDAGAADVTISRNRIQRFELGTGTHRARKAGIGALIGLAVGGAVGYASGEGCWDENCVFRTFREYNMVVGAVLGAVIGAGMGYLAGGERWRDAGLPARLGFIPTSSRSMAITSTLRF